MMPRATSAGRTSAALAHRPIDRATPSHPAARARERVVQAVGGFVEIARRQTSRDSLWIDLDHDRRGAVHRRCERLRAAHPAKSGGDNETAGQCASEMPSGERGERLVGALHDALTSDIDPAASGHLAIHGQAAVLELTEILPGRPRRHQQRVGNEHARRAGVGLKHSDRLARLDQQRLVVLERPQRLHDRVERLPVARRLSRSAVDDEIVRPLRDVGIEIVHQHPQRGFLRPPFAGQRRASRRADGAGSSGHGGSRKRKLDLKKRGVGCQFENEKFFT